MKIKVIFLVSRDWQVRRDEAILQDLARRSTDLAFYYVSEEEWTFGNASRAIPRKSPAKLVLLPKVGHRSIPVWSMDLSETTLLDAKEAAVAVLDRELAPLRTTDKYIVFYDGLGPNMEGFPSQQLTHWLKDKHYQIIFLQHGYLARNFESILHALKTRVASHRKHVQNIITKVKASDSKYFVYDWFAGLLTVIRGGARQKLSIVGNLNMLSHFNQKIHKKSPKIVIKNSLVIFSSGCYKTQNKDEISTFEEFVESLLNWKKAGMRIFIKFKSGERQMMSYRSRKFFRDSEINFLSDDLTIEQIDNDTMIACSASSNVGLELILGGKLFFTYTLSNKSSPLSDIYFRAGVPQFDVKLGQLIPSAYPPNQVSVKLNQKLLHSEIYKTVRDFAEK